jgi:hypothetical protein
VILQAFAARTAKLIVATDTLVSNVVTADIAFLDGDVVSTAHCEVEVVQEAVAAPGNGIGQANIVADAKGAARFAAGAESGGAALATAAFEALGAAAARATLTLDNRVTAAKVRLGVIRLRGTTLLAFLSEASVAADT